MHWLLFEYQSLSNIIAPETSCSVLGFFGGVIGQWLNTPQSINRFCTLGLKISSLSDLGLALGR